MHDAIRLFRLFDHAHAVIVIEFADFGRFEVSRGAIDQAHANAFFQLADFPADRGLWQLQFFSRSRKTPRAHHHGENRHLIEIIHIG